MAKKKTALKVAKALDQMFILHVSIDETSPTVWRRIVVPEVMTLEALHSVIQLSMGWQMSHLYDFQINEKRYSDPDEFDDTPVKSPDTILSLALKGVKSFSYNYDFGDDWRHTIVVEEVAKLSSEMNYPICIGGENACPPEDCGGTTGFEELKKTISSPKNPDYKEIMCWLGGYYNPTSFDANRINRDMLWMTNWFEGPNDQGLYLPFNFEED